MYFSERYKFIYFPTTKSASHAIGQVLKQVFDAKVMCPADMDKRKNVYLGCPSHWHSNFVPQKYKDFFKFTSVRNPYTRELSKFHWVLRIPFPLQRAAIKEEVGELNFDSYIKWVCNRKFTDNWEYNNWKESQIDTIYRQPIPNNCIKVTVDKMIRCESLETDFLSLPFVKQHHVNKVVEILKSKINSCNNLSLIKFKESARDIFCERFQEDFLELNYDLDKVPNYSFLYL